VKTHRHTPEQVVRKLREGDRLLNDGKDLTEVLWTLEISEATWHRWRAAYVGMKADEARRLRELEKPEPGVERAAPARKSIDGSGVASVLLVA
jgi:putative transposase